MTIDIVAQAVGLVASSIIIFACTNKSDNRFKFFIMLGSAVFACHYFLLGAYAGAAVNVVNSLRTGLSIKFNKSNAVMTFFIVLYLSIGVFTIEQWHDALPIFSGVVTTFAMYKLSGILLRSCMLASSLSWLTYDFIFRSIGGVITEMFVQTTNLITMYRIHRDGKKNEQNT